MLDEYVQGALRLIDDSGVELAHQPYDFTGGHVQDLKWLDGVAVMAVREDSGLVRVDTIDFVNPPTSLRLKRDEDEYLHAALGRAGSEVIAVVEEGYEALPSAVLDLEAGRVGCWADLSVPGDTFSGWQGVWSLSVGSVVTWTSQPSGPLDDPEILVEVMGLWIDEAGARQRSPEPLVGVEGCLLYQTEVLAGDLLSWRQDCFDLDPEAPNTRHVAPIQFRTE